MKRILIRRPGGRDVLELVREEDPDCGPGEVLVRVRAAGVNYADCLVRMGYYEAAKKLYPVTPGFEFAGTVEKRGEGVPDFEVGDRVFGITRFGGYTDRIAVPSSRLWHCPGGWELAECAGFPAVFLTAYYALHRAAKVERGETVLVHSAAGGAGGAIVQLARIAGCRVVGVVGAEHKALCAKAAGADEVIVRSAENLWKAADRHAPGGYDAVFDANGVKTLKGGYDRLAPGGRLVVYGFAEIFPRGGEAPGRLSLALNYFRVPSFSPLGMTAQNRGVMGFNVVYLFEKGDLAAKAMREMLSWIGLRKIKKFPVTTYPLARAAEAHAALESGTTQGKLVLTSE